LSLRRKLTLTAALLILALSCTALAARATLKAVDAFQQESMLTRAGDVQAIRPWMTIPYIAQTYHIPESYLYQELKLTSSRQLSHSTLHVLAAYHQRSVDDLIRQLQKAILTYRKQHSHPLSPRPPAHSTPPPTRPSPPAHAAPTPTPPGHDRHIPYKQVERIGY